jgi:hypothetical protein
MKKFGFGPLAILALLVTLAVPAPRASAAVVSATPVVVTNNDVNYLSDAWYPIVLSTIKAVKGIVISNTAPSALYLGIGASGAEVAQIVVDRSTAATYYPIVIGQGAKLSIKPLGSTLGTGVEMFSIFYN